LTCWTSERWIDRWICHLFIIVESRSRLKVLMGLSWFRNNPGSWRPGVSLCVRVVSSEKWRRIVTWRISGFIWLTKYLMIADQWQPIRKSTIMSAGIPTTKKRNMRCEIICTSNYLSIPSLYCRKKRWIQNVRH